MFKKISVNKLINYKALLDKSIYQSGAVSVRLYSTNDKFQQAVQNVSKLKSEPDNDVKLELYALFKQATEGKNQKPKPSAMDFVGKYKWQAWTKLGDMSKEEASKVYIGKVESLIAEIGIEGASPAPSSTSSSSGSSNDPLVITVENQVKKIRFNRPDKLNAFTVEMYLQITDELNSASKDDSIKAVIITGTGNYYSSGNDLSVFTKAAKDLKAFAKEGGQIMVNFIDAFIDCEKPVIAVVNGHAVGILATTLGLCDFVIASNDATFITPFSSTAQTPEGCASYTFPRILGTSIATKMLLFNYKLTAQEALAHGLVGQVVERSDLDNTIAQLTKNISANCATHSLIWGKKLLRTDEIKAELKRVNRIESENLQNSWLSPEFPKFIAKFFQKK